MRLSGAASRMALTLVVAGSAWSATAAELDAKAAHDAFTAAFNDRQWAEVKAILADDAVFHRANADQVYVGPEAILARFEDTIGAPDQWNVKFARLAPDSQLAGKDGRVVTRGDFAVTAGADDGSCYAGSFMSTWAPSGDDWKLQLLAWQDVETDLANCK